jgi:proline dehydrogenase
VAGAGTRPSRQVPGGCFRLLRWSILVANRVRHSESRRRTHEMVTKSAFLYLSKSDGFKNFLTRFQSFNNVTRRFVAGEELADAVAAIRILNQKGISASFDHLGESITSEAATREEVNEYVRVLDSIEENKLDSNVSVKLTQLGLDVSQELCYANTRRIVEAAAGYRNFVRIDMEESSKTEATLEIFKRLRSEFDNVGIVIQAYLYRTEKDIEELLKIRARIRLCKGAYKEPASVAFPRKDDVDANYVKLTKPLLVSGIYHGLATHDENMIAAAKQFAAEMSIESDKFEFQMLYGIRRDLQEQLVREGYRMRVYVPYGRYWYPYFMRRLAERPANIWFVLRNMMKG